MTMRLWPRRRAARWGLASALSVAGLVAAVLGTLCVTSGCSSIDYLSQSASGHIHLLAAARPVKDAIADPATPEALRKRLALTQRMREFAVTELKEPDNGSYRSYADLKRSAAVWNVVAAPELSLHAADLVLPGRGLRGLSRLLRPRRAPTPRREPLKAEGLEVDVYEVPAYSTLGWMNWIGGDPLLNTFVQWPEGELARLIFHELAHQVAYAPGDTTFNESFATAVEHIGSQRWLAANASAEVRDKQALTESRRAGLPRPRARLARQARRDVPQRPARRRQARAQGGAVRRHARRLRGDEARQVGRLHRLRPLVRQGQQRDDGHAGRLRRRGRRVRAPVRRRRAATSTASTPRSGAWRRCRGPSATPRWHRIARRRSRRLSWRPQHRHRPAVSG